MNDQFLWFLIILLSVSLYYVWIPTKELFYEDNGPEKIRGAPIALRTLFRPLSIKENSQSSFADLIGLPSVRSLRPIFTFILFNFGCVIGFIQSLSISPMTRKLCNVLAGMWLINLCLILVL